MEQKVSEQSSMQQNGKDTKVKGRNMVVVVLFLGWMFACLDRSVLSIALIPIQKEFGINEAATGIILSAFFLGFLLIQLPAGMLADKFGSRNVLLVAVIAWAVFTALTGLAWGMVSLIVVRFIFGFFDGFFPSASSKSIASNFPVKQRARAKTIVLMGSGFGGILSAIVRAGMVQSFGWRSAFYVLAGIGLIIFLLFWFGLKDKKQEDNASAGQKPAANKVPLKVLAKTPLIWSLGITSLAIQFVNWGVQTWMPIYLVKTHNLDLMQMGELIALSGIVMILAALLIGYILDKVTGYEKYTAIFGAAGAAIFLVLLATATNPVLAVIYQTLAQIGCAFVTFTTLTNPLKRFAVETVGTANGMINTLGQIGAFLSPMIMGFMIQATGSYTAGFMVLAGFVLVAAIAGGTIPIIKGLNNAKKSKGASAAT